MKAPTSLLSLYVTVPAISTIVDARRRLGDWEVDKVIGKGHRHAIVSLTERKSRFTLLKTFKVKTAQVVGDAMNELMKSLPVRVNSIASDNGREFANRERVAQEPRTDVYFPNPNPFWERASNEYINGHIRQYLPKKLNFAKVADEDIEVVMESLNNRPGKCLDPRSPKQVIFNHSFFVALGS